jgi:hypothetical protein
MRTLAIFTFAALAFSSLAGAIEALWGRRERRALRENLIAKGVTLRGTLCSALDYVRSLGRAESAEGGISHQALAAAYCFLAPPAARGARRRAGVMDLQVVVVAAESLK